MLFRSKAGGDENYGKKKELWKHIKKTDKRLFYRLRMGLLGQLVHLPGSVGRSISLMTYKISQKVVGFN